MDYPDWSRQRQSLWLQNRNFPMLDHDMPTFMGRPHAIEARDLDGADAVIIGAPYVTSWTGEYAGVDKAHWLAGPKRVRQQSVRYASGYIQDFDLDVFEHLKVVDYGDAAIPPEANEKQRVDLILAAQAAVEAKVGDALKAGAVPVVIGQNSPCGSYAIAKAMAERIEGNLGVVSLDTHWDSEPLDAVTMDPRIAGGSCWKHKMFEFHANIAEKHLVEIGERGMLENKATIRRYKERGARFFSSWEVRRAGIEVVCAELARAFAGTQSVYAHFDMDVLGGAGPAPGDILGELAEPIGLTDYEVIRIAHELGLRGLGGLSFICIPPGSAVIYRVIVYVVMYMLAGLAMRRLEGRERAAPRTGGGRS